MAHFMRGNFSILLKQAKRNPNIMNNIIQS